MTIENLIRQIVREELAKATPRTTPTHHSQLDGERPPGVGRARYLRAWRRGRDAGDPECTADGRARIMTAAAWQRHGASTPTRRPSPPPEIAPARDLEAEAREEIGLTSGRRAS